MKHERKSANNVTLADVAEIAGVAPMTVSRFLNQHPNISEKTARKVSTAIKRLGYTPNLAARILMGQPSNTIGLIVPTLADTFFSEIAHSVQIAARERGKLVWVASSESDPATETSLLERMRQHHVDGILLVPAETKLNQHQELRSNTPMVVLDRPLDADCDAILVDNRGGMAKLVSHFLEHGYKRILCLSIDDPTIYTISERILGYGDVMRKQRHKITEYSALTDRAGIAAKIRAVLKETNPPDAIVCTNNLTTIYALETLLEDNIRIPHDIAIGGFDDFEFASYLRPRITVVRQPAADLGTQAARLLFERLLSTDHRVKFTTTLPTSLIVRDSCGCKPVSA